MKYLQILQPARMMSLCAKTKVPVLRRNAYAMELMIALISQMKQTNQIAVSNLIHHVRFVCVFVCVSNSL